MVESFQCIIKTGKNGEKQPGCMIMIYSINGEIIKGEVKLCSKNMGKYQKHCKSKYSVGQTLT